MPIDPQAQSVIEQMKKLRPLPLPTLSPVEARKTYTYLSRFGGERDLVDSIEDLTIPVENGEINIRIYKPHSSKWLPILVYYHGGGWVLGDLDSSDRPCRTLANEANCIVISVDYRLAPEYKFPTAINDCYAAFKWALKHAHLIGGDSTRIAIGGDSAGGNLAAAVTLKAKQERSSPICFQLLIYPVTNLKSFNTESYKENGHGYYLTRDNMTWYKNHYLTKHEDAENPLASPLLSSDVLGLPPALIITAEYDPLRDEAKAYSDLLKKHHVPVEYICFEGMIHGFFYMGGVIDKGRKAIRLSADLLRKHLHAQG